MSTGTSAVTFGGVPRVNLIPRSELERRERAATARGWAWGILGAVLAAAAIVAGAMLLSWIADQRLAIEQSRTNDLLLELDGLSDVSVALATESQLEGFLAESMGSDFAWQPVISAVVGALPGEVQLSGFALTAGGLAQGEDPSAEAGLVGTLTLASPNVIDIARTVRELRAVSGVSFADGRLVSSTQQASAQYTYELTVTFDQSIYSGLFLEGQGGE
ncbi:hypothetical protein P0L94_06385 [Microbacter sp. GSS18]|nr:hypothetical protein P0L94_06385 [Microbacter sp. GSS18]